jgi:hypothetical protein
VILEPTLHCICCLSEINKILLIHAESSWHIHVRTDYYFNGLTMMF